MMHGTNTQVVNVLPFIPPNSIGVEIGVWEGNSSAKFINRNLKEFHMVDPWQTPEPLTERLLDRYAEKIGSKSRKDWNAYYERVYDKVVARFGSLPNVKIHRKFSIDFLNEFPDNYFDWAYVDGDHGYEGCKADILLCKKKVKFGGSIFGDDYSWVHGIGKEGVTKAVNSLINTGWKPRRLGESQFEFKVS